MEKTKKTAMAVAILCCAAPVLAQSVDQDAAQGTGMPPDVNPSWYIQPNVTSLRPDSDFGTDDRDWGGGIKLGKPVHPNWDIQIGLSHAESKTEPNEYRQTLLGVDALLMISRGRFRPFILFGVGAQRDRVVAPLRNINEVSPYATAGLGFQWAFHPQWSMQADFRTVRGRLREDELFGFERNNNKYLTVGINYAFSRPAPPPPPPPPAPPPAPVVQEPPPPPPPPPARFEKVTLSATGLFAFNSAALTLPQPRLDEIAAALQADPSITDVDITGYADRLGSAQYNLKLSEQRANAVRAYLVDKGIDGARLKAYGKGEANPVVTCTEKNRAALIKCLEPNRRVEVEQITIERRVQ